MTRGRQCIVCGHYETYEYGQVYDFRKKLEELNHKGVWAHPACMIKLQKFRRAEKKLIDYKEA